MHPYAAGMRWNGAFGFTVWYILIGMRADDGDASRRWKAGAVKRWLEGAWLAGLDIAFPIRCLGCGAHGRFVCAGCAEAMPKLDMPFCDRCASPGVSGVCSWCLRHSLATDSIRSPYLYVPESPIYRAITALKYRGMRAAAAEMADMLAAFLSEGGAPRFDVVAAVPSHRYRVRRRGYAQAALIASALAARLEAPLDLRGLERVTSAPSQLETESREERWGNVQGGFEAQSSFEGLSVLLVDDLVTTGATASACAEALKQAGAARVEGLCVARAP